jgi:hypothetical protein
MTMRQIWIPAVVVAVAIAGCTFESDEDVASLWRHRDGTPVSGAEIAQTRTACVRASTRELSPAETNSTSDPAFHPGGVGLEDRRSSPDFDSPLWRSIGRQSIPLADCLAAKGFVRAR